MLDFGWCCYRCWVVVCMCLLGGLFGYDTCWYYGGDGGSFGIYWVWYCYRFGLFDVIGWGGCLYVIMLVVRFNLTCLCLSVKCSC